MAKKRQHTHQYHRIYPYGVKGNKFNRADGVWACGLPGCTHYMPHNVEGQVEGKLSLCNSCMEPFILDEENMKVDAPLCTVCSNPDAIVVPDNFDYERHEAKSYLSTQKGIPLDEVTEEMIDNLLTLRAFQRNK